jgi:cytochrome c biogenesis protein CcdA
MSESVDEKPATQGLASLLRSVPELISRLISDEIRAARLELTSKLKAAALGAGMLVAGIVVGLFTLGVLIATAILGLGNILPPWLASLVVAIVLLIITAILVLLGIRKLKKGVPPVPQETISSVKEDVRALKGTN